MAASTHDENAKRSVLHELSHWRDWFSKDNLLRNLPYLCFISLLMMIYIGNIHHKEKTYRQTNKLRKELQRIRWEYMTTQAELMNISKQSELVRLAEPIGLKALKTPPKKLKNNRTRNDD